MSQTRILYTSMYHATNLASFFPLLIDMIQHRYGGTHLKLKPLIQMIFFFLGKLHYRTNETFEQVPL